MALVAPPLSTEAAAGRPQLWDRWSSHYFFKSPVLLLGSKQPAPADIFSDDDNHEKFRAVIADWEFVNWDSNSSDGWTSEELMLTAMPTSEEDAPGDDSCYFQEFEDFVIGVITDADNQHGNGDFKQSKTCSGGSGSKPDDDTDNMQQQQKQQHIDSFGTEVQLWRSVVAPTHSVVNEDCLQACHWETVITTAMNGLISIPGIMNCNNNNSGFMTISSVPPALNDAGYLEDAYQTFHCTDGAPVINFTEQKREAELISIFGSIITDQDSIIKDLKTKQAAALTTWIVASAAPHHATGNRALLSNFTEEHGDIFLFGGDSGAMPMEVAGHGVVVTETMVLPDVWYVPGLVGNMVSVSQLAELDYSVAFGRGKCYIRNTIEGAAIVGMAHSGGDGLFALDFLRVPLGR